MTLQIQRNKSLVLEAMTALFQHHDARAVEKLYARDYIQHNPGIPQGREALAKLVEELPASVFYEPGLIVAEGDFVAIHGRIRGWAPRTQIAVDIFRIENGRLAEHWDVLQDEASTEGAVSGLAMFSPDEREKQDLHGAPEPAEHLNYDHFMKENLFTVFSERDPERRSEAIRELYSEDAVLHEPHASVRGHAAISEAVGRLLAKLPGECTFTVDGPAVGHNGLGRLKWRLGSTSGAIVMTGLDLARFRGERISSLHVFLDPAGSREG